MISRLLMKLSCDADIDELLSELDYDCGPPCSPDRIRPRKSLISGSEVDLSSCKLQKTSNLPRSFVPYQSPEKKIPEMKPWLAPSTPQSPRGSMFGGWLAALFI